MSKPQILISNDDGIHAPGILALIEAALEFGEVTVVAPDSAQSGMGHAISIAKPLRIYKEALPHALTGYAINGTPADCVKLATGVIMEQTPDLILSGVNHGANSSVSAIYSGTMSAAREGSLQGIPSVGFSLLNYSHEADMSTAIAAARAVIGTCLEQGLAPGACLNVNIPDLPLAELKGYHITRHAMGRWIEEFAEREDPYGRKYYWLTGSFSSDDIVKGTDVWALENGYVSVAPMTRDMTDYPNLEAFQDWKF
ncbi:MAG: 5'/3'-nucleotidase SurE [Bacteroidota bacterium]